MSSFPAPTDASLTLPAGVRTCALQAQPALAEELANWLQQEREQAGYAGTRAQTLARLTAERPDSLPCTRVALAGQQLVGAATLTHFRGRLAQADALWLTNLWVHPRWRRQGIGAALTVEQQRLAHTLGRSSLWLYTRDQQAFYLRLGWCLHQQRTLRGKPITIMKIALSAPHIAG